MLIAWCLLTCYSRMYLGVHYPGDLLFGAVVGTLSALLCWFVTMRLFKVGNFRGNTATAIPVGVFLITVIAILIYAIAGHFLG